LRVDNPRVTVEKPTALIALELANYRLLLKRA